MINEAWINPEERNIFTTVDKDGTAYQAKGTIEYHWEGEIFDDMKIWNPEKHPGHAAVALQVEEVYSGAEKVFG